jgi:hypothetical protein
MVLEHISCSSLEESRSECEIICYEIAKCKQRSVLTSIQNEKYLCYDKFQKKKQKTNSIQILGQWVTFWDI